MLKGLEGKTVLVTGAAGGIGQAAVRRLLEEGANVVGADLRTAALEPHPRLACVDADLGKAAGAAACVATAVERFGGLDLAFLNAGVECRAIPIARFSEADYERVFDVNVRGVFLCAQAVVNHLLSAGKPGSILCTSSIAGLTGTANTAVYNASKHAVIGIAKSLAQEVGAQGIRVNVLCPGAVETRMMRELNRTMGAEVGLSEQQMRAALEQHVTLGRYARPEEMAAMAAWILSDEAAYCHGETFTAGGGMMAG